ncbi:uncharacterized protein LOC133205161 [Saccostrea echinata]|uniref:uncharacterized protein LOC133205161 n=1 Tax=Saccostrea echinata TaxID=191078 RepID=UPI002A83759E|nr:uncharacterized protein LOC133205161 [Saccostrea echinata]
MAADDKTKLILHVDHLYKTKLFHCHESNCCDGNLNQFLTGKETAEDIDKVLRGLIYLSQRNQILKTVCSKHFVVTFNRKPWKISQKITFKKNGKILKVYPFLFEVTLTCKKSYLKVQGKDTDHCVLEDNNTTQKSSTRSSRRVQNRSSQLSEEQSPMEDVRSQSGTRYSSILRKQKQPLRCIPSRQRKPKRNLRQRSHEERASGLSFDQNVTSSSEDENRDTDTEKHHPRKKGRRAIKKPSIEQNVTSSDFEDEHGDSVEGNGNNHARKKRKRTKRKPESNGDWLDRTRFVVVQSPETHLNTSGDIPLNVLTEMSAKKRIRENDSSLLEKTYAGKGDKSVQMGKSFHTTLNIVEEEDGQVADILGTALKKSKKSCNTTVNVSVLEQSCRHKKGLNLYKGTDAPLLNLPSLESSLIDPPSDVTQHLNFKDSFPSPQVGLELKGQRENVNASLIPLSRFNSVDFPVKDRHLIEREEIAEDIKLQEMSKPDSDKKSGVGRLSFGKNLWETLDTYFISPVKSIFEGK